MYIMLCCAYCLCCCIRLRSCNTVCLCICTRFACSGSSKPKSFLEIQQEQESDFGTKVVTTQPPSGVGGGATTPTANKVAKVLLAILLK